MKEDSVQEFHCNSCGNLIEVIFLFPGDEVECKSCNKINIVPDNPALFKRDISDFESSPGSINPPNIIIKKAREIDPNLSKEEENNIIDRLLPISYGLFAYSIVALYFLIRIEWIGIPSELMSIFGANILIELLQISGVLTAVLGMALLAMLSYVPKKNIKILTFDSGWPSFQAQPKHFRPLRFAVYTIILMEIFFLIIYLFSLFFNQ